MLSALLIWSFKILYSLYSDNKLPEGFEKANNIIIDVLSTWKPIFDEIDKDYPDAKCKAEKKVDRNLSDDTEGRFCIHKLNPKKVSRE
ncbi:hypothetical protein COL82_04315 [Bacillus toyonensis]|uniref:hypothetical protein n=1 Tax=Bacillus toyonensis TaxID=155322 RepID=UPI000BF73C49|nr:hypothetical protein COL82_04315 [Bacillus toyonensis]